MAAAIITNKAKELVGRFGYGPDDRDDVIQDLWVRVWPRIKGFTQQTIAFSTYLTHAVNQATASLIAYRMAAKRHGSYGSYAFDEATVAQQRPDYLANDNVDDWIRQETLSQALASMTPFQQEVCRVLAETTVVSEIARQLGVSRYRVEWALPDIRKIFRDFDLEFDD